MKTVPKAYSYLRFSTPDQSKGDSFRRQTEASHAYAKQHKLELDESLTFKDLGVSAYRGKNIEEGALGAFLKAVEDGRIRKGSYLLVENLDRLSRDTVDIALERFTGILRAGIVIVTLTDGRRYTKASLSEDISSLMLSIMTMFRAHEESALKSKRLSAAWKAKRDKAQSEGSKLTALCPAWLTLANDRKSFVVDEARKSVIRRIFKMTIAGHGKSVIARRFNEERVPTFGSSKAWHASYVQKILENEAVVGTARPMRMEVKGGKKARVPDGAPILDYFPAIIDRATFERARRSRESRRIPVGRKGLNFSNLFSGLAVCGNCGAPMHFVNKGEGTKGGNYLACSNARRAASNCKAPSWRYGPVEALLIVCIEGLNYNELFPDLTRDTRTKLEELEDRKLETESELSRTRKQLDNIADLLIENPAQPTLQGRLNVTQANFATLSNKLTALQAQIEDERERAKNAESDFRQVQDGLERLDKAHKAGGPQLYDLRSRLHQLLKRTIQQIQIHPSTGGAFVPKHSSDWAGKIEVGFHSTKNAHTLYVAKGFRECQSVPVRNGKEVRKRAVVLTP